MGYKILGINLSHNSSVCVLDEGKIVFFLEEDRLSRFKHDPLPINLLKKISLKFKIDSIAISGLDGYVQEIAYTKTIYFLLKEYFPNVNNFYNYTSTHHLCHSYGAFYNSGFDKALSVVIDGAGNCDINHKSIISLTEENETLQVIEYPFKYKNLYKGYSTHNPFKLDQISYFYPLVGIAKTYEAVTNYLGFRWHEAGKTMGLSSYGKPDKNIPSFYKKFRGNSQIVTLLSTLKGKINFKNFPYLKLKTNPKKWHKNFSKITNLEKNIAYKVQQESQQVVGDLIEKSLKETGLKQVCCSGGYFLNCVTNYYLTKRFPNIEFYFEPVSNDAGTSTGAAKLAWHEKTQDKTIRPQKTLYYGPEYTKGQLLEGIQKYLD